jgi:hypothetical protein
MTSLCDTRATAIVNQKCVYIILLLLHISALLESRLEANRKAHKERQLKLNPLKRHFFK